MFWFYFWNSHTSHITSVLNQTIRDLSGYIFYQAISRWPCEYSDFDTIFLSPLNLFPAQNLSFIIHYHLFHCEGCALRMLGINKQDIFPTLALKSLSTIFMLSLGTALFLFQRTIKFFFGYLILFFSWGMCWNQCQIVANISL